MDIECNDYYLSIFRKNRESKKPPKMTTKRSTIFIGIRARILASNAGEASRRKPVLKASSGLKNDLFSGKTSQTTKSRIPPRTLTTRQAATYRSSRDAKALINTDTADSEETRGALPGLRMQIKKTSTKLHRRKDHAPTPRIRKSTEVRATTVIPGTELLAKVIAPVKNMFHEQEQIKGSHDSIQIAVCLYRQSANDKPLYPFCQALRIHTRKLYHAERYI
jgi:hypothetical protein